MAEKKAKKTDGDEVKQAPRRPSSNKVKLHKYFKRQISLMRDQDKALHYKHMMVSLLKDIGPYPAN